MTPRHSLTGVLAGLPFMQSFKLRAAIFCLPIAILSLLAFFPERYNAEVTLTPADPQSLGLTNTNVLQLGGLQNVFGNQSTVEIALRVGQSKYVRDIVIKQAKLESRMGGKSLLEIHRWLEKHVIVRGLRGTIVIIELKLRDPVLARDIVGAYADATRDRLAIINRSQAESKRDILIKLISEASSKLAKADAAYDQFRLRNRAASPEGEIGTLAQRIDQLEGVIKAKQIELAKARQIYTERNPVLIQQTAELAALQGQLADMRNTNPGQDASLGRAIEQSGPLFELAQERKMQRALYDSYMRLLENSTADNLSSDASVRILEPPFIETERQVWWPAIAGAIALLLVWGAIEFYRLRPPVGADFSRKPA